MNINMNSSFTSPISFKSRITKSQNQFYKLNKSKFETIFHPKVIRKIIYK